jgi:hypothetical protein
MKPLNPAFIKAQIDMLLVQFPELLEDDVLRADTIEGQTDLHEFLRGLEHRRREASAMVNAIGMDIDNLKQRQARFDRRDEAMRGLMFKLLESAELKRLELPEATLSIANGRQKVVIVDESLLPEDCLRIKTEPDKTAIKAKLDGFETVPGACLSNPEPHLTIRVK